MDLFPFLFPFFLYIFWFVIPFLWLAKMFRVILFWAYLWQLKEYHLGRFIDYFTTTKGKHLLWNKIIALKLALFCDGPDALQPLPIPILLNSRVPTSLRQDSWSRPTREH